MTADRIVAAARALGVPVIDTAGAIVIVIARPAAADRLSVAAVAQLAGCTARRVREAARSGELVGAELTERALSFGRADVIAWLDRHPIRVRAPRDESGAAESAIAAAMTDD